MLCRRQLSAINLTSASLARKTFAKRAPARRTTILLAFYVDRPPNRQAVPLASDGGKGLACIPCRTLTWASPYSDCVREAEGASSREGELARLVPHGEKKSSVSGGQRLVMS